MKKSKYVNYIYIHICILFCTPKADHTLLRPIHNIHTYMYGPEPGDLAEPGPEPGALAEPGPACSTS